MRTMNDQDTFAFENREYVSPTVSRDEQLGFIDNFRDVRNKNVARINADTYNLGTQVPSIRGGLGGSNATFESRYVTPYVNSTIQGLKTTAQQTALTQALENLQAQYKQRYNEAYRAAKARANAGGGGNTETSPIGLDIEDDSNPTTTYLENNIPGTVVSDTGANVQWTGLNNGSLVKKKNYPTMSKTYHPSWDQMQDLFNRGYTQRELNAIASENNISKSGNSNNGFYVNGDGKIIGFGHDIDRSSGQFVPLDKGL